MLPRLLALTCTAITLIASSAAVTAQERSNECGERAESILRALYPQAEKVSGTDFTVEGATARISTDSYLGLSPYAMVCRQWPAQPEHLLVALPLLTDEGDHYATGDLVVAVLRHDTLSPVAQYRIDGLIDDDAISLSMLDIDTAPYRLVEGRLAFGVRMSHRGASRVNPFYQTGLLLFNLKDTTLRPLLLNLEVERHTGEWDGICNGTFSSLTRTLAIGKPNQHRGAEILITTKRNNSEAKADANGDCNETEVENTTSRSKLQYDGQRYSVPAGMRVWE
jgi:hypothetical protein